MKDNGPWRKDTTSPHPLFGGNVALFNADKRWRMSVSRSCNDGRPVIEPDGNAKAQLNWMQRS